MAFVLQDYEKLLSPSEFAISVQKVCTLAVALRFSEKVSKYTENHKIWGRIKRIPDNSKDIVDEFWRKKKALKKMKKIAVVINELDYDEQQIEEEFNEKEKEMKDVEKLHEDYDSDLVFLNDEDNKGKYLERLREVEIVDEREIADLQEEAGEGLLDLTPIGLDSDLSVPVTDGTFELRKALDSRKLLYLSIDAIIDLFITEAVADTAAKDIIEEQKLKVYESIVKQKKNKLVPEIEDEDEEQREQLILLTTQRIKSRRELCEKLNYLA